MTIAEVTLGFSVIVKLLAGAAGGALVGWLLGHARACSVAGCNVKARLIFSMLGGAVFGAAVVWYFLNR